MPALTFQSVLLEDTDTSCLDKLFRKLTITDVVLREISSNVSQY